jgi:hypothetical protein
MRVFLTLAVCLIAFASLSAVCADDLPARNSDLLTGITSVRVRVTDLSKTSGMPPTAAVKVRVEELLQARCNLTIVANPMPGSADVEVELLMIEVPVEDPRVSVVNRTFVKVSQVRFSVWRTAVVTGQDGARTFPNDPARLMAAWVSLTTGDPRVDPQLELALNTHVNGLANGFRTAGQLQSMPPGYSEPFYLSRLKVWEDNLVKLINAKLTAPDVAPSVSAKLSLQNGILTYKFTGQIVRTVAPIPSTIDLAERPDLNSGRIDIAALAAIGALPDGKLCINDSRIPGTPICVTIREMFQ